MKWNAMLFLGAFHGINPGMGWLFAVALGMQQGSSLGVLRALPPLATGHAAAVGAVVLAAMVAETILPPSTVRTVVALVLVGFGLLRLVRHRHPRWVGMQVGFGDLTLWSFLMASAHGVGLMVLPFLPGVSAQAAASEVHASHHMTTAPWWTGVLVVSVHSLAYLAVTTIVAWIVHRKLGLALLRKAWWNLDLMWAISLMGTGILALFL